MRAALPTAQRWTRLAALGLSAVLWSAVVVCYLARWDAVAVVTLLPFWTWAIVGIFLSALAWRLRSGPMPKALLAVWLVATVVMSDDLLCLYWPWLKQAMAGQTKQERAGTVRIACLNCASQIKAVEETLVWRPDIVLLQESPASNDLARLCREQFGPNGGLLYGLDCSILARGPIQSLANPRSLRFIRGRVSLPQHGTIEVVSVRLQPPDTRLDLWSPDCWRQHAAGRKLRRGQLQELVNDLPLESRRPPLIVGGDYNAPAGDGIFKLFGGFLKDAFREAGRGWGNTAINTFPISRPDQIWVHAPAPVKRAWVKKTEHSDHRMVLCDVALP